MEVELWKLEEGFWRGDHGYYERNLDEQATMLFPEPVGLLNREEIVQSISESPRWSELGMDGQHLVRLGPEVVLLSYLASAERAAGDEEFHARITSAYTLEGGSWKLKYHQQVRQPAADP